MKTTKNILLGFVAILTLLMFFQACDKISYTEFEGTHVLEKNMAKQVVAEGKQIWMEIKEIEDSRCPVNAACVWAGVATAKISFDDIPENTVELCLGACDVVSKPKTQEITINSIVYTVELKDVTPYPGPGVGPKDKKATIVIAKK